MDLAVVVVGSAADVEVVVVTEIGLFVFFFGYEKLFLLNCRLDFI